MRQDKIARVPALLAAALALGLMLGACGEQGSMEDAGERADEAIEDTGDQVEDATD